MNAPAMKRDEVLAVVLRDAEHANAYRIVHGVLDSTPQKLAHESGQARAAIESLYDRHAALVEAAFRLEVAANTVDYCYTKQPGNFAAALRELRDDASRVRAALAAEAEAQS